MKLLTECSRLVHIEKDDHVMSHLSQSTPPSHLQESMSLGRSRCCSSSSASSTLDLNNSPIQEDSECRDCCRHLSSTNTELLQLLDTSTSNLGNTKKRKTIRSGGNVDKEADGDGDEDDDDMTTTMLKPYECRFCPMKFAKSQALGGHMNRHRQEREREQLLHAKQLVMQQEWPSSGFMASRNSLLKLATEKMSKQQQQQQQQMRNELELRLGT